MSNVNDLYMPGKYSVLELLLIVVLQNYMMDFGKKQLEMGGMFAIVLAGYYG